MSINTYYYKELVEFIRNIFINYNKKKYLCEFDIQKDIDVLYDVFLEPTNNIKENYLVWNDDVWIESMKYVKLGLLSFLYKNKASLYKIYTLLEDDTINQYILLEKYKNLFKDLMANKNLSCIQNYIIQEHIEIDEIEQKKYFLLINLKNFKNPKFGAYLFDILTYKTFRNNIIKVLLDNIKKIDIESITDINFINEENNILLSSINNLIDNDFFYSFSNFLMFIEFEKKKNIVVNKQIHEKVSSYIKDMLEYSSKLNLYIDDLVDKNKDAQYQYKSNISLIIVSENVNSKDELNFYVNTKSNKFEETYKNSNNIYFEDINLDLAYERAFVKKEKIKFTKWDYINRISHIIYLFIEFITITSKKNIETKLDNINVFIQNTLKTFFSTDNKDSELVEIIENIKKNGIFIKNLNEKIFENKQTFEWFKEYTNEILKDLITNKKFVSKENILEIKNIFIECIEKLKYYRTLTVSGDDIKNFNVFTELFENILKNKNLFKIILLEILQEKHLLVFISIIETSTFFKINQLCKKKIIELSLDFMHKMIEFINMNDENQYVDNCKVFSFAGKFLDKLYIIVKSFSDKKNDINVKKVVKYSTIKK